MKKEEGLFYRYAQWAEDQDDLDDPMLYGVVKFLIFQMLPLLVVIIVALIVLAFIIGVLAQIAPWIWNLVWV